MLDSHLGVPDAVPEADAWRTGSYLASMDRALLLFDFDPAGSVLSTNANFLAAMGYASDELTLRHDMLCDSMDEGKGIASAEQIWARLRRGEHLRHLPLPPPQWRRAVDRGHLPAADQSGRRGRAHLGRLAQVHRRRRAAGRGAPAAAGHQRDRQRRGRVRPGRPHRLRQRGLSPHARLRPPTRSIRSWANCWPAAGRMAARAKSWIAASPAARATTRTCWSTIAPASRYGCLSWPTPCSTSAARWSTWWMC